MYPPCTSIRRFWRYLSILEIDVSNSVAKPRLSYHWREVSAGSRHAGALPLSSPSLANTGAGHPYHSDCGSFPR